MVKILFFIFLFFLFRLQAQFDSYSENAWGSFVWKHKLSAKWGVISDVGYRTFDRFIGKRRQDLGRLIIERKLNNSHSLGIGLAYFESIKSSLSSYRSEFRPFFQYQFIKKSENSTFAIRFRNELRYYTDDNIFVDRSRIQFSYEYKQSRLFTPKVSVEGFVSAQTKPLIEQRYSVGNSFTFNDRWSLYLYYTVQIQSNIVRNSKVLPQHIVGVQIILNTTKNEKQK